MTRHRKRRFKIRSMYNWHRYVGVTAALFVLILSTTGVALNHTETLQLDERFVTTGTLLDWYNIQPPKGPPSFRIQSDWVSQWDTRLFLNENLLGEFPGALLGATRVDDIIIVAVPGRLMLFTPAGELIEELVGRQGVPAGMRRIGLLADGRVATRGAHGIYMADANFLTWEETDQAVDVSWSSPQALPGEIYIKVARQYRAHVLPLERVILDLHSGRIAGTAGVFIMDAAALLLIFLALSGTWIWIFRILKQRRHRKSAPHKVRATP